MTNEKGGQLRVYPDAEALSLAAAELFAARAAPSTGRFAVALAGGQTPRRTYELLTQAPLRERVPWARLHVFWSDERCVAADDPRSNECMAREALLAHVPIPSAQVHPIACAGDPFAAAGRYEALLRATFAPAAPRFDLVFLGLGDDGHTASLFPGSPALHEKARWAVAARAPGGGPWRVTLTAPLINQAVLVAFLLSGASKAPALRAVLQGPRDPARWPAQLIRPVAGEVLWLVDAAAAG